MQRDSQFDSLVRQLETLPQLRGRLVVQVPELCEPRLRFRAQAEKMAFTAFALSTFNAVLAFAKGFALWWLSAVSVVLMVGLLLWAESRVRAMNRQLRRRAAEQVARDHFGIRG